MKARVPTFSACVETTNKKFPFPFRILAEFLLALGMHCPAQSKTHRRLSRSSSSSSFPFARRNLRRAPAFRKGGGGRPFLQRGRQIFPGNLFRGGLLAGNGALSTALSSKSGPGPYRLVSYFRSTQIYQPKRELTCFYTMKCRKQTPFSFSRFFFD